MPWIVPAPVIEPNEIVPVPKSSVPRPAVVLLKTQATLALPKLAFEMRTEFVLLANVIVPLVIVFVPPRKILLLDPSLPRVSEPLPESVPLMFRF